MLKIKIVSSRTVEEQNEKFVAYMLQVHLDTDAVAIDPNPANVERRYTEFLDLYKDLKKDHHILLDHISFPRKIVFGNFDPSLISSRCNAFTDLLYLVSTDSRLRESPAAISFFRDTELNEARRLLDDGKFDQALSVLETSFRLLNKVYTDRSHVVLGALCRLVACAAASGGALAGPVEKWAQLSLRRYEGVSDSDLLLCYVPLLHSCIAIWETLGRDKTKLVQELNNLRKQGMKVDSVPSLMESVDKLCL